MLIKRIYGCKADKLDHRDRRFLHAINPASLPLEFDLEHFAPPVMDQSTIGSCTGHGIACAWRIERIKNGLPDRPFSRLQIYFDERNLEGTVDEDAGAEIRDGIKVLSTNGVAPEELWPYDISKFKDRPTDNVYGAAKLDVALTYSRVNVSALDIKAAIASGHPVIIGISVFESFEGEGVAKTGIIPMPTRDDKPLGGHCMCVIGYGQKPGYFKVRNSWGATWGDNGNCFIPEAYLGNPDLGSDYWIIESIKSI